MKLQGRKEGNSNYLLHYNTRKPAVGSITLWDPPITGKLYLVPPNGSATGPGQIMTAITGF